MIGYDNLPSFELKTFNKFFVPTDYQETSKIKKYIANQGFQEVINYSFVSVPSMITISKKLNIG